jgi:hypothetical protein
MRKVKLSEKRALAQLLAVDVDTMTDEMYVALNAENNAQLSARARVCDRLGNYDAIDSSC